MKIESVGLSFSTNHQKRPPYITNSFPEEWLAGRTRIGVSETRAKMLQETKEPLSLALLCRVETSIFKPLWKISLNILKVSHFESIILWGYPQSCPALAEQLSTLVVPQPSQATETFAPVGLHCLGLYVRETRILFMYNQLLSLVFPAFLLVGCASETHCSQWLSSVLH